MAKATHQTKSLKLTIMKSKILGVLALVAVIVAVMCFALFAGTPIVYCGVFMLLVAAVFVCACVESLPNYNEIANRIADFFTEG